MTRPPVNSVNGKGGFGRDERDLELLAAYALGCLDDHEEREIDRLLAELDRREVESFEVAAAATLVASVAPALEPMPDGVKTSLKRFAKEWAATNLSEHSRGASSARGGIGPRPASIPSPASSSRAPEPRGIPFFAYAGWLAAAACLALAAVAWMPLGSLTRPSGPVVAGDGWLRAEPGMSQAELARVRSELIVREGDTVLASWTTTESPDPTATGATGDLIWSTDEQCGVMRIAGLSANDPKAHQYQLWIFDEDQKHPIDGGVFDIPASGEVFLPVDAKLWVNRPVMFAITVEKPGGVVVSDRSRIALLGASLKPISECSEDEIRAFKG